MCQTYGLRYFSVVWLYIALHYFCLPPLITVELQSELNKEDKMDVDLFLKQTRRQ